MCEWPKASEKKKGDAALAVKGKFAAFYSAQYRNMDTDPQCGNFAGLACRTCNHWDGSHKEDCSVPALENGEF